MKISPKKIESPLSWETVGPPEYDISWISCHIEPLDWTYSVEPTDARPPAYQAFLIGPNSETIFLGKPYKKEVSAIKACEKHLNQVTQKLSKLLKTR